MMHNPVCQNAPVAPAPTDVNRWLDAVVAAVLGLLSAPVCAPWLLAGTLTRTPQVGQHGHVFQRLGWQPARSLAGRVGWRLGVGKWLAWVHVLKGELAWVGPRALGLAEAPPSQPLAALRSAVRPGVCSLWQLRQLTSIDYGTEWDADAEQLRQTGVRARWALLARCLVALAYGNLSKGPAPDTVWVDTVKVHSLSMSDALDRIDAHVASQQAAPLQVAFVNPDCVNIARRDVAYRRTVNQAGLVLPDGIGMRIAGKLLHKPFRQNVNGTDLFPRLCDRLGQRGGSLYLLGAQPGVAAAVANWVAIHHPGVRVVGAEHGFFGAEELPGVLARIQTAQPDVLLVAMGAPAQDRWIAQHAEATGAKVALGVGGLFDFYSGRVVRAPQWVREIGLEWAFRLLQEPGRLWRRYLVGNVSFLIAVALQRLLGSAGDWDFAQSPAASPAVAPVARRGVVLAFTDGADAVWQHAGVQPACLPLGDRPLVMRTIETLAAMGCEHIDVLADLGLDELACHLGDGTRWGARVRLHRVANRQQGVARLKALDWADQAPVVLARADQWLPVQSLVASADEVVWVHADQQGLQWAGWACVQPDRLAGVVSGLLSARPLADAVVSGLSPVGAQAPYSFATPTQALQAQARWMAGAVQDTLTERAPGVRIAPSARIAADAVVVGPVEILPGAVVASGAVVGPHAHVGAGAVIEAGAVVRNAMLAAGTYVSSGTTVEEALVLPTGLISARWDQWLPARLTLAAAGPLDGLQHAHVGAAERLVAAALLAAAALPAGLAWLLGSQSRVVRHLLPGLPQVICGRMPLVGVCGEGSWPASVVDAGWSDSLQQAPRGLVTPALALGAALGTHEARAWADIHWLANPSWSQRWQLLAGYVRHASRPTAA